MNLRAYMENIATFVKTTEQLEYFLNGAKVKFNEDQIEELRKHWYNITQEIPEVEVTIVDPYEEMTKDQLDEYAINNFGIDLDKRFTKENMIEELNQKLKEQDG